MADQKQPPQPQQHPGRSDAMTPEPRDSMADYQGRDLLKHRRALITGGDSGIGRAVAIAFAKEGADVAIAYLDEHDDAKRTSELAPSYLFFASEWLSSCSSGEVLAALGGETHPG